MPRPVAVWADDGPDRDARRCRGRAADVRDLHERGRQSDPDGGADRRAGQSSISHGLTGRNGYRIPGMTRPAELLSLLASPVLLVALADREAQAFRVRYRARNVYMDVR